MLLLTAEIHLLVVPSASFGGGGPQREQLCSTSVMVVPSACSTFALQHSPPAVAGWLPLDGETKITPEKQLLHSRYFQGKGTGKRDIKAANPLPSYQLLQGKAKEEQTSMWAFLTP